MTTTDVVILGAGPYGLAAANHLKQIKGLEVRIFGDPMSFWQQNMPIGMFLRSGWEATHIADPNSVLTLETYQSQNGTHFSKPVPLDKFVDYGKWYQRNAIPDLDRRRVVRIGVEAPGFRVTLSDGETLTARRVVIAAGIGAFAWLPAEFQKFPSALVSHTSVHSDLKEFSGKQVAIIGGGQSALESAALLHECGGTPEVFARTRRIHWLQGFASRMLHFGFGKFTNRLLYAPTDVGPAGISQLMARPDVLRRLPRKLQDRLRKRAIRPAGAGWLVARLREVPIHLGRSVESAQLVGERVKLRFDDGTERTVDHVLLGTGYRIDVSKYDFLDAGLLKSLRMFGGFPILQKGLETSIPGLHIIGAPAAWSFGPLMQFVSGTHYVSKELTRRIMANGHAVS